MVPQNNQAPAVLSGLCAYTFPSDASAASAFYQKAFGAEEVARMPAEDGKRLMHCHLHLNGSSLMMSDVFPEHGFPLEKPAAFSLHLHIKHDIQAWWDRAVAAGCTIVLPLQVMFWGDTYGQLKDPFGVSWSMGQPQ